MFEKLARGSFRLARFVLRRERLRILIWTISLVGIAIVVPIAFNHMFVVQGAGTAGIAVALANPSMVAMIGPSYAEGEAYTIGAMNAQMMLVFMAIAIAIMNIFLVIRYTRRDEELGRQEVIRSLPVGRLSPLSATLIVALLVNLMIGLLLGFGLTALNIPSIGFTDSMLYGLSLTTVGLLFAAVAAIFSQLCQTASSATGWSMAFMIGSYLLRAVGDMDNETLSRISPLGLVLRTEVAVNNHWWPVFILLAITIALFILAFWLNSLRDIDRGFIPTKAGRSHASKLLVRPIGLSLRLMRGIIIAWAIGVILLGASYGSILGDTEAYADIVSQVTGGSTDARDFISVLMVVMAVLATVPCLMMILKLRGEEKRGRLEGLLAAPISRRKIFMSYLIPALIMSIIMPILAVYGLWAASSSVMTNPIPLTDMLSAIIIFIPSIWIFLGLATILISLLPTRTSWIWAYLTLSFFIIYLGNMLNIPEWIQKLSPFGHVPYILIQDANHPPIIITALLAITLLAIGSHTYKRRDMI